MLTHAWEVVCGDCEEYLVIPMDSTTGLYECGCDYVNRLYKMPLIHEFTYDGNRKLLLERLLDGDTVSIIHLEEEASKAMRFCIQNTVGMQLVQNAILGYSPTVGGLIQAAKSMTNPHMPLCRKELILLHNKVESYAPSAFLDIRLRSYSFIKI